MTASAAKAIILGSASGVRRLDSDKSYPVALIEGRAGKRVLDWILVALSEAGIDIPIFVGGYHIEKVIQRYPQLRFYYNPRWEDDAAESALRCVRGELTGQCVIAEADAVFRSSFVRALLACHADIAVGSREDGSGFRDALDDNFGGVALLSPRATSRLCEYLDDNVNLEAARSLSQILAGLRLEGEVVASGQDLARVSDRRGLSRFVLGTKAQTLDRLRPLVREAKIHDQVRFTVAEWRLNPDGVLARVASGLPVSPLIVRSSATTEDSRETSQAGRFRSEVVGASGGAAVGSAIESVVESFARAGSGDEHNQVFVQPYIPEIVMSGVLFSRDPESGAPYITVNYDDRTGRTDTVTSGIGEGLRTAIVYRDANPTIVRHPELRKLIDVVSELEELIGEEALDLEFGFDTTGVCHLFQVRPLVLPTDGFEAVDADVRDELRALEDYIEEVRAPRPHIEGRSTILANMPDWNPAEIIGTLPRPLAWSLYKHLITDTIWGQARALLGYYDTFPEPLIVLLAGHPYVDTRVSLNSFLPERLDWRLRQRLVDHCLDWLRGNPAFHDKLEFEVAIPCLDFDFERSRQRLSAHGFNESEIEELRLALRGLTDDIVSGRRTTVAEQLELLESLERRRSACLARCGESFTAVARTVRTLLDDCKRYGTLPFSILARYAFIATSFLRSLKARSVLSAAEVDEILASMPTVASRVTAALACVAEKKLSVDAFLKEFGHLRPGTYDLLSPSYAEVPHRYLSDLEDVQKREEPVESKVDGRRIFEEHQEEIGRLIAEAGFTFSVPELQRFVFEAIPAREQAKFEFSKNINATLALICEAGHRLRLSLDDMSFLPIERLLVLATDSPSSTLKREIERAIGLNRKRYLLHRAIKLPHMLEMPSDTTSFEILEWLPNFVTGRTVRAAIVDVDQVTDGRELRDCIALIRRADPGYDWVFARGICGLITQYGGVASHMAIRAGELSLPAAIGCGELLYERVRAARVVELDCAGQKIRVVV